MQQRGREAHVACKGRRQGCQLRDGGPSGRACHRPEAPRCQLSYRSSPRIHPHAHIPSLQHPSIHPPTPPPPPPQAPVWMYLAPLGSLNRNWTAPGQWLASTRVTSTPAHKQGGQQAACTCVTCLLGASSGSGTPAQERHVQTGRRGAGARRRACGAVAAGAPTLNRRRRVELQRHQEPTLHPQHVGNLQGGKVQTRRADGPVDLLASNAFAVAGQDWAAEAGNRPGWQVSAWQQQRLLLQAGGRHQRDAMGAHRQPSPAGRAPTSLAVTSLQ